MKKTNIKPRHHETKHKKQKRTPGDRKDYHIKQFKTPKETTLALQLGGIAKTKMSWQRLFLLGIMGGFYVMVGAATATSIGGSVPNSDPGIQKFLFALTFPVGLAMIVLVGGELFTGNCMFMPLAWLSSEVPPKACLKVLLWTYFGNFIGTVLSTMFCLWLPNYLETDANKAFWTALVIRKVEENWGLLLVKSIPANMCVCAAIHMGVAAEDVAGKLMGMWVPIFAFAAIGWEHSIANMALVSMGIFVSGQDTYYDFLWRNLLPVTIGNIIGGSTVAIFYWYIYLVEAHEQQTMTEHTADFGELEVKTHHTRSETISTPS